MISVYESFLSLSVFSLSVSLCSEDTDLDDDTQVQKGYMELEETLQQFKQKSHLMNLLEANKHVKKPEKDFLERFYEGSL